MFATILGVFSLGASIAAPILWVGDIKETNAVQEQKIKTLEKNYEKLDAKMDALLLKNGINPASIKVAD